MIVVTADAELALAAGLWLLLWAWYEAIRERGRQTHKRHLSEGELAWHSLLGPSR